MKYQLGLFGHPVEHSQSPKIHAEFAKQFDIDLDYQLINTSTNELPIKFRQWIQTAHGCNVTVPHKNNIMPLLDHYTERAQQTQAVNTVFWRDDKLWGDNTDGDGLVLDLKQKNIPLKDSLILIIGAGGATQGIIPSLLEQGAQNIRIKNRDHNKAKHLATKFNRCKELTTADHEQYDLIIHATSMGHHGLYPEMQKHWFHDQTTVYDLNYGEAAKAFLKIAQKTGATQTYDGLGMLYGQAAMAFKNWFGFIPEIKYN